MSGRRDGCGSRNLHGKMVMVMVMVKETMSSLLQQLLLINISRPKKYLAQKELWSRDFTKNMHL